jgi:hypothetical protein
MDCIVLLPLWRQSHVMMPYVYGTELMTADTSFKARRFTSMTLSLSFTQYSKDP